VIGTLAAADPNGADVSQVVAEAYREAQGGRIDQDTKTPFGLVNAGGVRVP
jgi:hypothetical protein